MSPDTLAVWMDGYARPAGFLTKADDGATAFVYAADYVDAGGLPLSLSLPIRFEPYGDVATRAYFANLLPEDNQLQRILDREGLQRNDVVGLLGHLGADCAGAVSCLPLDAPPVKTPGVLERDYEPLDDRALVQIVKNLAEFRRLPAEVDDPSPVAGVQGKVALTVLADGRYALPRHGLRVPTTHILKVPEKRHGGEARLEEAAALLARACSLDVSVPRPVKIGLGEDRYDALLITRFDRRVENGVVTRIHQEDFAQALGLPSDLKYQRNGRPGRCFDLEAILSVLDRTADPGGARVAFILTTLFNFCIGNTDNHAKNHAVLYGHGAPPQLAPLYDLLPIRLDRRYTHQLAYNIGAAEFFDRMTGEDLHAFLTAFGITDVTDFVEQAVAPLIGALEAATRPFRSLGLKSFDDLIGRETEQLVDLLSAAVVVRERDAFHSAAGGWGSGS